MSYRTTFLGLLIVALAAIIFSTTRSTPAPDQGAQGAAPVAGRELSDAPAAVAERGVARTNFIPKDWDGTRRPQEPTRDEARIRRLFEEGARKRLGNGTVFMGGGPRRSSVSLDKKPEDGK